MLTGVYQVFVRTSGCNLECAYCDTPETRIRGATCRILDSRGRSRETSNPVAVTEVFEIVSDMWTGACHSVSLTGGEPLLQAEALGSLLELMGERGFPVYLETNGTLHWELSELLPRLDWIAMDVKLPSSQGGIDILEDHRHFLRLARSKRVFVKIVIEACTGEEEFRRACRVISDEAPDVPLALQPVTTGSGGMGVSFLEMISFHALAAEYFQEVRVIPQIHHILGAR
ncbi:MAG: 7-carboxy-7-deazaguanine synthase QueE [Actinomycetota bacterium]|nr:7-carboxy-7-deazaguanine synthase QueE [Actinomycetota bacterium]